ncbi:MAG: ATP-binding protein [Candidatus Auribacterota bacterium]
MNNIDKMTRTILIVEDDFQTAEMLEMALSSQDFHCVIASCGNDAISLLDKIQPDVVLLDIGLPDIDGFDVCVQIKNRKSDNFIPVIMLTARDDTKSKVSGLYAGADDYITKPCNVMEVVARIRSMLRIKTLQDELIVKNEHLNALNAVKDEFLSICTHDLRNIIMPIMEASSCMKETNMNIVQTQKMADIIHRQSKKMVGLVNSLLESFQCDYSKVSIVQQKIDLPVFLKNFINDCKVLYASSSIEFRIDIRSDVECGFFDPEKIDEVLTNLISNAVKFTPEGGAITLIIDTYKEQDKELLLLAVQDTGDGIPCEELGIIFDKYVTASSNKKKLGTGLGLSICKTIVQEHGGKIWAESKPGFGSVFYFTLPQVGNSVICGECN